MPKLFFKEPIYYVVHMFSNMFQVPEPLSNISSATATCSTSTFPNLFLFPHLIVHLLMDQPSDFTKSGISERITSPGNDGEMVEMGTHHPPGGLVAKDARSSNICHGHLDCLQPVEWKRLFCFPHFLEMEMNSASVGALRYGNEHDSYRSHQWTCQIPPTLTFTSIETVDGIQSRSCNDGGWQ